MPKGKRTSNHKDAMRPTEGSHRKANRPAAKDYWNQLEEYWPTIMQAWMDWGDKHPIIECDVVKRKVYAYPAPDYIAGLTERTRETARQQYERVTAEGGMLVFIRDSKNRVLQSYSFDREDITSS